MTMKVKVKLFATFREGRFGERIHELPEGTTVSEVIAGLGLGERPSVIFVNNRHATPARVLEEGDSLALFPPVGGG